MAASKRYFPKSNHRFLPSDRQNTTNSTMLELDESEIWNSAARSPSPEYRKPIGRGSRKTAAAASAAAASAAAAESAPASLPVNIPDWSKILKDEYRENRRSDGEDFDYEEEEATADGGRIPPHEFLARTRVPSSMQEGKGRTLKGRDLNRVRNAIWQKIGFQD